MRDIQLEIKRVRKNIVMNNSGWGSIMLPLKIEETSDVPLMATNGVAVFYNEVALNGWFDEHGDKLARQILETVFLHEVLHVGWQHMTRMGKRNPEIWNIATDLVINTQLRFIGWQSNSKTNHGENIETLGGIDYDSYREYFNNVSLDDFKKLSAEKVYQILITKNPPEETAKGIIINPSTNQAENGHNEMGGGVIQYDEQEEKKKDIANGGNGKGIKTSDELSQEITERIIQSDQIQKAVGQGSEYNSVGNARNGQGVPQDWRDTLRDYASSLVESSEQSYKRPNRRFVAEDMYLPSNVETPMMSMAFAIDISGSVGLRARQQMVKEIETIQEEFEIEKVYITYINDHPVVLHEDLPDTDLMRFWDIFERGEEIEMRDMMNGGTSFKPFLNLIEKTNIQNEIGFAMYFTDCESWDLTDDDEPDYPFIWATTGYDRPDNVSWGETVNIYEEGY